MKSRAVSFMRIAIAFMTAVLISNHNLQAQVTTCGFAEGSTSYTLSSSCTPRLAFSVSGRCMSACGGQVMTFASETVAASGFCQLGMLDRNFNGVIDDGHEVFGDETPQLPSKNPNGFLALAVFDEAQNGGNEDGKIDRQDSIYDALQLWTDSNHDGRSSTDELQSLANTVRSLDLDYQRSEERDEFGHELRYWTSIERSDASGAIVAVNVFFANRRAPD